MVPWTKCGFTETERAPTPVQTNQIQQGLSKYRHTAPRGLDSGKNPFPNIEIKRAVTFMCRCWPPGRIGFFTEPDRAPIPIQKNQIQKGFFRCRYAFATDIPPLPFATDISPPGALSQEKPLCFRHITPLGLILVETLCRI